LDQRVDVLDYDGVIRRWKRKRLCGRREPRMAITRALWISSRRTHSAHNWKTLSEYWQENFARPLELDFWIGLPEKENSRVATIYAAKSGKPPEPAQFYRDLVRPVRWRERRLRRLMG
jgi:hypothetical protein